MKVAILAGGVGSRLSEETELKPKPMVEIGGKPILWHIMMHYSHYGFKDFVIALGYKGDVIKKYMLDYCALSREPQSAHQHRPRRDERRQFNGLDGRVDRHGDGDPDRRTHQTVWLPPSGMSRSCSPGAMAYRT